MQTDQPWKTHLSFHCLSTNVLSHSMEGNFRQRKSMPENIALKSNLVIFCVISICWSKKKFNLCITVTFLFCKTLSSCLYHSIKKMLSEMEWLFSRYVSQLWGCLTSKILEQLTPVNTLQLFSDCNKCFKIVCVSYLCGGWSHRRVHRSVCLQARTVKTRKGI